MNHRIFARRDRRVSEVGLGTWQLGGTEWGDVSEQTAFSILDEAAEAGVDFLDTADIYGGGRSEALIGRWLARREDRDRFFVATKLGRSSEPGWPENFTAETIRRHTEGSLERIGTSTLDLTQTHCIPGDVMAAGAVFGALAALRDEGLIRGYGASVESVAEAEIALDGGVESLQIIFNVLRQRPLESLLGRAHEAGCAVIVRLPLASGLLGGRLNASTTFGHKDHRNYNRDGAAFNVGETFAGLPYEKGLDVAGRFRAITGDELPPATAAVRWILDHEAVTTVIPGATKSGQISQNAMASDAAPLSEEVHAQLRTFYSVAVAQHIRGEE